MVPLQGLTGLRFLTRKVPLHSSLCGGERDRALGGGGLVRECLEELLRV